MVRFVQARAPLLSLLIAATIPVLLFAGWTAYRTARDQRAAAVHDAGVTVDRVGERIAAEIGAQIEAGQALALSSRLDAGDLVGFRAEAERLKAAHPLWFTMEVDEPDGQQTLNLFRPQGSALGRTADQASWSEVLRTHQPAIGGVGPTGPVTARRLVSLRVPVMRNGELRSVITIQFASDAISQILRRAGIPEGWSATVVDGSGNIIARSDTSSDVFGQRAGLVLLKAVEQAEDGFYEGPGSEGVDVETRFRVLPRVGRWSVHLAIPTDVLEGPVQRALYAVAAGVLASLILAMLLAALTAQRYAQSRRSDATRAAAILKASEDRMMLALEAAELGMWQWDLAAATINVSERFSAMLALKPQAEGGRLSAERFAATIHADDRDRVLEAATASLQNDRTFDCEFRIVDENARTAWFRARGRALAPGTSVLTGILIDVSAQKRAERERVRLMRRLSHAQEEVQARIARELHDQVGQTVTGLSLGLKGLEGAVGTAPEAHERIQWLQRLTSDIGRDLHRAAVDLRPTALDDLGLQRALQAYAGEWGDRFGIEVDVDISGPIDQDPSPDIATAVYRIVQEAMTNILKHASARHVSLMMERRDHDIRVVVEDDGVGFDPVAFDERQGQAPPRARRLGISGMRERLAAIGGSLEIESSPSTGTTLFISVPVKTIEDDEP